MFTKNKLSKLNYYYTSKSWKKLFNITKELKESDQQNHKEEALRYEGLAYYKLKKYTDAIISFGNLCMLANFRTDWYNLAMAYVKNNDPENSETAFQKTYAAPPIHGYMQQISTPMMIFLYTSALADIEQWEIALKRLTELKQMYVAANTGDETKLNAMGLPSISAFYHLANRILINNPSINQQKWFSEIKRIRFTL